MKPVALSALLACSACSLLPSGGDVVPPDSTGHMSVQGDESGDTALEGIGLSHFMGQTVCLLRLYDDSNLPETNAHYGFSVGVGGGGLSSYATGEIAQGAVPPGPTTASFRVFTGVQHVERIYTTTAGTLTMTRFDAQRITGSFSITGTRACLEKPSGTCTSSASGTFDAKNEDCFPPLVP